MVEKYEEAEKGGGPENLRGLRSLLGALDVIEKQRGEVSVRSRCMRRNPVIGGDFIV